MSITCNSCGSCFTEKNLYINHYKKCVQKGSLTLPDGQDIVLWRNQDKKFLCYCSNPPCPKSSGFTTLDGLKQHMKNLETIWLGPEKKKASLTVLQARMPT